MRTASLAGKVVTSVPLLEAKPRTHNSNFQTFGNVSVPKRVGPTDALAPFDFLGRLSGNVRSVLDAGLRDLDDRLAIISGRR